MKRPFPLLLGIAYRKNTGDIRESPAVALGGRLRSLGAAVSAVDPHVEESLHVPGVRRVELTEREIRSADVVILLADHDAFDLAMVAANARYIFDTRHRLTGANVEHL